MPAFLVAHDLCGSPRGRVFGLVVVHVDRQDSQSLKETKASSLLCHAPSIGAELGAILRVCAESRMGELRVNKPWQAARSFHRRDSTPCPWPDMAEGKAGNRLQNGRGQDGEKAADYASSTAIKNLASAPRGGGSARIVSGRGGG